MTDEGPDMTPRGIADAIDDLAKALPRSPSKPDDSWQRVLAFQVLNAALGDMGRARTPTELDPDGESAAWALRAVLVANLHRVLRHQPALFHALITAFDLRRR